MNIHHIELEPDSVYTGSGSFGISPHGQLHSSSIHVETDALGQVYSITDTNSAATGNPAAIGDAWDILTLTNNSSGRMIDVRPHTAALRGDLELATAAIGDGADVNLRVKQGATPLHWACAHGHEEVARLLIDAGADVNSLDELGWTPLTLAARGEYVAIVALLLERGARENEAIAGLVQKQGGNGGAAAGDTNAERRNMVVLADHILTVMSMSRSAVGGVVRYIDIAFKDGRKFRCECPDAQHAVLPQGYSAESIARVEVPFDQSSPATCPAPGTGRKVGGKRGFLGWLFGKKE